MMIEGVSESFSRVFNKYIVDGSGPEPEVTELLIVVSIVLALLWLVQRFVSWVSVTTHTGISESRSGRHAGTPRTIVKTCPAVVETAGDQCLLLGGALRHFLLLALLSLLWRHHCNASFGTSVLQVAHCAS